MLTKDYIINIIKRKNEPAKNRSRGCKATQGKALQTFLIKWEFYGSLATP